MRKNALTERIAGNFAAAASTYDAAASVQADIVQRLIGWAAETTETPRTILDLGCGTGFVSAAASARWPGAKISALDAAPAMLRAAQRKLPSLKVIGGDAAAFSPDKKYDLILSSLMLHWLPEPRAVLARWQNALNPGGKLYVALLIDGSFAEWRAACRAERTEDGLWPLPAAEIFADTPGLRRQALLSLPVDYPSALDFLKRLKATGAATPRAEHRPANVAALRRILLRAKKPFTVTYRAMFLACGAENA